MSQYFLLKKMPNGPQVHNSIRHVSLTQTLSIYYMVFLLLFHMGGQFWASKSDNKCENKTKSCQKPMPAVQFCLLLVKIIARWQDHEELM